MKSPSSDRRSSGEKLNPGAQNLNMCNLTELHITGLHIVIAMPKRNVCFIKCLFRNFTQLLIIAHGTRNKFTNPLNAELNPICCLLTLFGAHYFLHVSRIRVKSSTLRLQMSYIYIYIYIWSTHS